MAKDSDWVQKILHGDPAASEQFVQSHYPRLYRFLHHLTGSAETAEDLTQQTFVKAWQALKTFRNQSQLKTWMHRIAYHEYTHWLRAKREHASLDTLTDMPAIERGPNPDSVLLTNALNELSDEHREAFLLYHVQELSIFEVSEVLGVPQGTIKSRLFNARQHLREILSREETPTTSHREETPKVTRKLVPSQVAVSAPTLVKENYPGEITATVSQHQNG